MSNIDQIATKYKVVIVGDSGVGKTTFVKRHSTGEFEKKYNPTMGVEVTPLPFHTNEGLIILNIWDCSGSALYENHEGYFEGADAFIIMFTVTSNISYKGIGKWYQIIKENNKKQGPIVLCGNKVDCKDRHVSPKSINFHRENNLQYYDISAKSNYNFEKPFLSIIRELKKSQTLHFIEAPAKAPPEVNIVPKQKGAWSMDKNGCLILTVEPDPLTPQEIAEQKELMKLANKIKETENYLLEASKDLPGEAGQALRGLVNAGKKLDSIEPIQVGIKEFLTNLLMGHVDACSQNDDSIVFSLNDKLYSIKVE